MLFELTQARHLPQGKLEEAEPLYTRSLAIREKALGPDHPAVATSLNNKASLLQDMVGASLLLSELCC